MNTTGRAVISGGSLAVAVTFGIAALSPWSSTASSTASPTPEGGVHEEAVRASAAGVLESVAADTSCDMTATPSLPHGDPRVQELLGSNWASQSAPPGEALTRDQAIEATRLMSSSVRDATSVDDKQLGALPAAATKASYRAAGEWFGGSDNPLIAPERCVWVVTVNAPYAPAMAPDPSVMRTYESYTAMFDARSGQFLAVGAGTSASNLITGDGVTKQE